MHVPQNGHAYTDLPACLCDALDGAVEARRAFDRRYHSSDQPCYSGVYEQSGVMGYAKDNFQVYAYLHGRLVRLGRVRDSRLGALLVCASLVDGRIQGAQDAAAWIEHMRHSEEAACTWISEVGARVALLPAVGHGGRSRKLLRAAEVLRALQEERRIPWGPPKSAVERESQHARETEALALEATLAAEPLAAEPLVADGPVSADAAALDLGTRLLRTLAEDGDEGPDARQARLLAAALQPASE